VLTWPCLLRFKGAPWFLAYSVINPDKKMHQLAPSAMQCSATIQERSSQVNVCKK